MTDRPAFGVETIEIDLPPLVSALSRRLRDAGVPITPGRSAGFAEALSLAPPAVLDGPCGVRFRSRADRRLRCGVLLSLRRSDRGQGRRPRGDHRDASGRLAYLAAEHERRE